MKKIVVDIYGADAGAAVVVRGVAKAMQTDPIFPVLVGSMDSPVKPSAERMGSNAEGALLPEVLPLGASREVRLGVVTQ